MKTKQTLVPLRICKSPAYEMNPVPISYFESLISSYDPQTEMGKRIYSAFMNYDKKCSQAKIDLIDDIKIIITPPVIPLGRKLSKK